MRKTVITLSLIVIPAVFLWTLFTSEKTSQTYQQRALKHDFALAKANTLYGFDLLDPEQSPPEIHDLVMKGYRIIMNTPFYAPEYCGNQLSCTNCHFCGGDTIGGRNTGISLVGVTTEYPRYSERDKKIITISDRIDNCFMRSMNGKAPPKDAEEKIAIIAYLKWISKEVEHLKDIPWLGIDTFKIDHKPNAEAGAKIYEKYCVSCHKADGQGGAVLTSEEGKTIPPLWGPHSFNDGAGMSKTSMMSGFVYWSMPYQSAMLSKEEALDVTAYVLKQPRPHFVLEEHQ